MSPAIAVIPHPELHPDGEAHAGRKASISREDLIAAKADPDKYRSLTIRVAGYTAYFTELSEIRDVEAYKTVLPKGLQVAKENAERAAAAGQEVIGLTLKTNEALGQLAKSQFEAASESAQATVAKATKTVKGK